MEILERKRPHGGQNQLWLAEEVLTRLPHKVEYFADDSGEPMAYVITLGESRTLFTSHLDTVHADELAQNLPVFDPHLELIYKQDKECLGADCGTGVWLMYRMIEANVPGTYMFTMGEEHGGVGARWVAENCIEFLKGFDRAVAFDRAGTTDVITHQAGTRCCSDIFATALSDALGLDYVPHSGGIYTDTAEFTEVIPECTNISVGYDMQHSGMETQDTQFLRVLLPRLLAVNWEALPTTRDPKAKEIWRGFDEGEYKSLDEVLLMPDDDIEDWVYGNPSTAAELFIQMKYETTTPPEWSHSWETQ